MHYLPFLLLPALLAPALSTAETLEEITVVATRRPAGNTDVSVAVSTVAAEEVALAKLATDALAGAVGVSVQQTTPGQGAAIIRGLKGSSILHLVDGMRLNNAIFRSAPTPYFALLPTGAIERLEVLRGAPASLYGSEAVAGVVQAVTRLPDFDAATPSMRGDLLLTLDTAEQQRGARATLDAGTHRLAGSLSAEYLSTGDRRTGSGERIAPTGYSARGLRAVTRGRPDDDRAWYLDFHFVEQPDTPRIDELVPGFGQQQPSSSEFLFAPSRRLFAHGQFEHGNGPLGLDWQFDLAWQRIDDDRVSRDFEATERRHEENRSDLYSASLNASAAHDDFDWIAGVDASFDEVGSARFAEDVADGSLTAVTSRFPDGATVTQAALFGNVDWHASERHRVHGGLRFSDVTIDLPAAAGVAVARFSGDIGWVYDAGRDWQVVANLGEGFRAPNVFDLGTLGNRPGNRFNIPNTTLDAERVTHGDVGVRLNGARSQFEVVLFALRYRDRITSVSTGETTPGGRDIVQSVNAADASLRGAELGLKIELSPAVTLRGRINYAWGRQQIATNPSEPADRVPPLGGALELEYAPSEYWQFEAWVVAATAQDRLSARDVRDVRINPLGTPGWSRVGARATWYANDAWELRLSLDNLLDERYRVHGSGIDAPGRNLALSLRHRW